MTKQSEPEIDLEWYQALSHTTLWKNRDFPDQFPIVLRYTFDLMLPHKHLGTDGKRWPNGNRPLTALTEKAKRVVRDTLALWQKSIGKYFQFVEVDRFPPDSFHYNETSQRFKMHRNLLNSVHFFHHGPSNETPTGQTFTNSYEPGFKWFAESGLATDIERFPAFFNYTVAHEIGHIWEKHPVNRRDGDKGPFIDKSALSPSCNDFCRLSESFQVRLS